MPETFDSTLARMAVNDIHRLAMFMSDRPEMLFGHKATIRFEADSDEHLRELIENMWDHWRWDGVDMVAYLDLGIGARIEIDCHAVDADTAWTVVMNFRSPF